MAAQALSFVPTVVVDTSAASNSMKPGTDVQGLEVIMLVVPTG